jgi:hypothetical protein
VRANDTYNHHFSNILQIASADVLPEVMACILILTQADLDNAELREIAVQTLTILV